MGSTRYDEIGPWSEIKLEIIKEYAGAYTKILTKQSFQRFVYIDAFAGAGKHVSKATGTFVPGSPQNALLVNPPFSEFHFIDLNDKRVAALTQLANERDNVFVHQGDCNQILIDTVFPRCRYEDYARALCLLDPYSLNVNWQVFETAGRMKSIEVFYNFMIMDANMNVLFRDPDTVSATQRDRMTAAWGDESWRSAAYKKTRGLFDDIEEKEKNDRVAEAFRKRLRDVAGFEFVPQPISMKNSSGAIIYYLFFASPNRTGAKIVKSIFDKYKDR
jgi:three-Cys-motif partner protein